MITATQRLSERAVPVAAAMGIAGATGALTLLALASPAVTLALLYAVAFVLLAWRWPAITLMLIFASAPFQRDLSVGGPVRFSIAEIHLALAFPVFLIRTVLQGQRVRLGPVAWPVLLYLGICLVCSLLHWRPTSLVSLVQIGLYSIIAVAMFGHFAPRTADLRWSLEAVIGVGVGLSLMEVVAPGPLEEWLGLNKNGLGASLACALVVCMELYFTAANRRRRTLLMLAMAILGGGLLLTLSRGSWMACASGAMVIVVFRRQFGLMLKAALLLVPILAVCWSWLPAESRDYATSFDGDRWNINMRYKSIEFAKEQFRESPIVGVGVGLRKEYDATNVVLLTLAETGVPGLVAFLWIHVVICAMGWRVYRRMGPADPLSSFPILAAALMIGRLAHGSVDHYWSRGAIMIAWGSVGMLLAAQRSMIARRGGCPIPAGSDT